MIQSNILIRIFGNHKLPFMYIYMDSNPKFNKPFSLARIITFVIHYQNILLLLVL